MPGSRVIVANIIKLVLETKPLWNTLPPLSREPLEGHASVKHSINRLFLSMRRTF